jgi:hypothetical protein
VRLFKGTPVYFDDAHSGASCRRRDDGVFSWIASILGFPKTPCYQPSTPPSNETPCTEEPPPVGRSTALRSSPPL